MRPKVWSLFAILHFGPRTNTVVQDRLQLVKMFPRNCWMSVHHDAGDGLLLVLSHDRCLAFADFEAFVQADGVHQDSKPSKVVTEGSVSTEDQVIGVSRVLHSQLFREARQSTVQ